MVASPPVTDTTQMDRAFQALDDAEEALAELDAGCCVPGRSPRMKALAATLRQARATLEDATAGTTDGEDAIPVLEEAGAQIGRLQITCCAPSRLPLYTRMLADLSKAQRTVGSMDH